MELFGIEMSFEEFDALMVAQSNGKELKIIDGKVVAVEHEPTEVELKAQHLAYIEQRLNDLSQDFIQAQLGAEFNDLEERKKEFRTLHNELRVLLGKEPRNYIVERNIEIDTDEENKTEETNCNDEENIV